MSATTIEWAEYSINPLKARNIQTGAVGHFCTKISPGCKNCYSSKMQNPYLTQLEFLAENRPKVELFFDDKAIQEVLRRKKPTRYFWCDMTDMFMDDYPDEWIDRCFATMVLTPQHTHLVLTKRDERLRSQFSNPAELRDRISAAILDSRFPGTWGDPRKAVLGNPSRAGVAEGIRMGWRSPLPDNIWLGVSVEDQQRKDRIELLRQIQAAVRFLSIEPLLEDIGELDLAGISWVIVGGESGSNARPFNWEWADSILDQCREAKVPFFMKQGGSNCWDGPDDPWRMDDRKGGNIAEFPQYLRVREYPHV